MTRDRRVFDSAGTLALGVALLLGAPQRGVGQAGAAAPSPQNPLLGSVPTGQATSTPLSLSLKDALDRALKYNLGVIESYQGTRAARAERLRSLNALLPNLNAHISNTVQQLNLKALGFNLQIPGISINPITPPFSVQDARAAVSQEVFNWSAIKNLKSSSAAEKASQDSYKNDRELVVLTTANAYLLVVSDAATVDSTRAQVETARVLYQRTSDQHKAGVVANIDELRSQVEFQTQQQRLIAAQNQLDIDKLTLGRVIGLPNGQEFQLTGAVPYAPLEGMTVNGALQQAYTARSDYLAAREQVRSAELSIQAAGAENYPSLSVYSDFGDIGSPNFATSHETFTFEAMLNIPIFQGTRVRADKLQADSALRQRQSELEDLRGKIDDEVRTAFLNLKSSSDLVAVARSNTDLANQTLKQAQDRFLSGVADNLEVVQAQESVASAQQSYIASLYSYNLAKVSLAQAMGVAEQSALHFLGEK